MFIVQFQGNQIVLMKKKKMYFLFVNFPAFIGCFELKKLRNL